jgi:parallel beta-helix repeat protein
VTHCTSSNNGFFGVIMNNGSDDNIVQHCTLAQNSTGLFIGGGGGLTGTAASSNTRILSNTLEGNVSDGIGIIGGSGHAVTNNISMNNGGHGVFFRSLPVPGSVTDSSIISNRVSGNALGGIEIVDSDDNTIVGNQVSGNVLDGIVMRSGADNNVIRGNEFDANLRGIFVTLGGGLAPENTRLEGNHAMGNSLFDVQDQTIGDGTLGTDSTYRGTRCDTSDPAGICVPFVPTAQAQPACGDRSDQRYHADGRSLVRGHSSHHRRGQHHSQPQWLRDHW